MHKEREDAWTAPELDLIERYFTSSWTKMTLYQKLQELPPRRTWEAMCRRLRRAKKKAGFEKQRDIARSKLRIGYLDIETTGLEANFDFMVTWFIKYAGLDKFESSCITKQEIFNEKFDRRLVLELFEALQNFDILWTHYGSDRRFDVPFIRSRCLIHGLDHLLPLPDEKFVCDTWLISRAKLRLSNNRLGTIADALGLQDEAVSKTPISGHIWTLARVGNKNALKYIIDHNRADVVLLERVADRLAPLTKPIYKGM